MQSIIKFFKNIKGIGLVVGLILVIIYFLIFFNRFFPIQEGWFQVYIHYMQAGKTPYKDFFLFLSPLYPLLLTSLSSLFGHNFIIYRYWGLFERISTFIVLYFIYLRLFPARYVLILAFSTLVISTGFVADGMYGYYYFSLLMDFLSAYLVLVYFSKPDCNKNYLWLILAGLFGGLSFITKQTTGLIVPFTIFFVIFITQLKVNYKKAVFSSLTYGLSWLMPFIITLGWLYSKGAIESYFNQAFVGAASSKGSLSVILFGLFGKVFKLDYIVIFLLLFLVIFYSWFLYKKISNNNISSINKKNKEFLIFVLTSFILLGCTVLPYVILNHYVPYEILAGYKSLYTHLCFYFLVLASAYYLFQLFFRLNLKPDREFISILLMTLVSFAVMYSTGMSDTICEASLVPGLGLMFGIILTLKTRFQKIKELVIYFTCFWIIIISISQKSLYPYQWWGWLEPPVKTATINTKIKYLEGFKLSPKTDYVLNSITQAIIKNSSKNDSIYVFPHMPVFYVLSERYPVTFATVHWWDVCPDSYAIADAKKLQQNPPKVIVYMDLPEEPWKIHEMLFRKGKPSGQRVLRDTIFKFATSNKYTVVLALTHKYVDLYADYNIYVFARKK